jgi:two-component system chemotaxis response regulator CheY
MIKVLVVDDSKAVHSYIEDCFEGTDGVLEHAYNGKEALSKILPDLGSKYNVVLLDWEMPVMNGPELLTKVRLEKLTIPIIMMTTKNAPGDISQMLDSGASEYIMKPFTQDIVFEKIESVTGLKVVKDESRKN